MRHAQEPEYVERERGASVGRWVVAVAVLAVLTVVATIAINMFGGDTRDVQVPDVSRPAAERRHRHPAESRVQDERHSPRRIPKCRSIT